MSGKKISGLVACVLCTTSLYWISVSGATVTTDVPVTQQQDGSTDAKQKLAQKLQQRQQKDQQQKVQISTKVKEVPSPAKVQPKQKVEAAKASALPKKNASSASKVQQRSTTYIGVKLPTNYQDITIAGEPVATIPQAVTFLKKNNTNFKLACTPERLVRYYWEEASPEGVRPDLAFCQAIVETGFFRYGGDVVARQNNFCGLGTIGGGARGAKFATPQLGVRAHIQHLLAYSRLNIPKSSLVDPRYKAAHNLRLLRGLVEKWSGLNGTWAMDANYCEKIMYQYVRLLATVPGQAELQAFAPKKKIASGKKLTMRERLEEFRQEQKF